MDTRNSAFVHQSNKYLELEAVVVDEDGVGINQQDLESVWHLYERFTTSNGKSRSKKFKILFSSEHDRQLVFKHRPWVFKSMFIAVHWSGATAQVGDPSVSPMWVQFEVPRMWRRQYQYPYQVAEKLGNIVGRAMVREDDGMIIFEKISESSIRVRVEVDLKLPLIQKIKRVSVDEDWVQCTYEGVHRSCKKCSRIGHVAGKCKFNTDKKRSEAKDELDKRIHEKGHEGIEIDIKGVKSTNQEDNAKRITAKIQWCPGKYIVTYNHSAIPSPRGFEGFGPSSTAADVACIPDGVASHEQRHDYYSSTTQNPITGTDEALFADHQMDNVVAAQNNPVQEGDMDAFELDNPITYLKGAMWEFDAGKDILNFNVPSL